MRNHFEEALKGFSNKEEIKTQENKKRLALAYNGKGYNTIYFFEELKKNIDYFDVKRRWKKHLIALTDP